MKDIHSLITEINSLPKGNVYKKTINGKEFYYHQYSINGEKHSKIIKKEELIEFQNKINKRIQLEIEVKAALKIGNRNLKLSSNAKNFTGSVLKEDEIVATFKNGELIFVNEDKCPYIIKRTRRLEPFLKTRVIDGGRTNSRILKKALSINYKDDELVSLCSYAASITDNYWFRPTNSKLKYKDIEFNNDLFFNLSLSGLISFYPNKIILTPELTTNGSYEKGWKLIDGEWYLYKVGTKEEIFSELFYSRLFEFLDLPTAHYEYEDGFIKTRNFARGYCFEPIVTLVGEDESYEHVFRELNNIRTDLSKDYLRLCFFDIVLNNIDRHNENCGVLRDLKSGKLLGFAPNYDNNLSLISRGKEILDNPFDGFYKQFISLLRKNKEIKNALLNITIPSLDAKLLEKCYNSLNFDIDLNKEKLFKFIMDRYQGILKELNK